MNTLKTHPSRHQLFVIIYFLSLLNFSCGSEESLTPFAEPLTLSQQQALNSGEGGLKVRLSFNFSDLKVERPINIPVPLLGGFIQDFGNMFANILITANQNEWDVRQDAAYIDIPEFDLEFVRSVRIVKMSMGMIPGTERLAGNALTNAGRIILGRSPSLNFIESINLFVWRKDYDSPDDRIMSPLATYQKTRHRLGCDKKCINFAITQNITDMQNFDLTPMLSRPGKLFIIPVVQVNKTPRWNFEMQGTIEFEIEIGLPF